MVLWMLLLQELKKEIFRIILCFIYIPVYKVLDYNGEEVIKGTFYQPEIQRVSIKDDQMVHRKNS